MRVLVVEGLGKGGRRRGVVVAGRPGPSFGELVLRNPLLKLSKHASTAVSLHTV